MSAESKTSGGGFAPQSNFAPSTATESGRDTELRFADFRLLPAQRRLERDGIAIPIGGRAFDLLVLLASRPGEVISKAELLGKLWQGRVAEESSLRFHVTTLRKVLGDKQLIANIAGHGYCFVAPVSHRHTSPEATGGRVGPRLPSARRRLVGRDEILKDLPLRLAERRFVTIVGPGGIGKTSIALATGHQLSAAFDGDVCFFDVSNESNSRSLTDGLSLALGLSVPAGEMAQGLAPLLSERRVLLILDGCEVAIDAVARLAEDLVHSAPGVHVLATSREAMRANGEHICRLPPLLYPVSDAPLTVRELLDFPSVELFVERASAGDHTFAVTHDNVALVGAICRKLDGLALAIEIAAGRVEAYGVAEVERQLESQFSLRWPGRRTAVSRHQTLTATLDWSHTLLAPAERVALRRLSIFPGHFSLTMAVAILQDAESAGPDCIELLTGLVAKSLVQPNLTGRNGTYRLLDTTRAYACEKLVEAGEGAKLADRHARLVLQLIEAGTDPADLDRLGLSLNDFLSNVRAALKTALAPGADQPFAAALACATQPIWTKCGLMAECVEWTQLALEVLDPVVLGPKRLLDLQLALSFCALSTRGLSLKLQEGWSKHLLSTRTTEELFQASDGLLILWSQEIRNPDYPKALSYSVQAERIARELGDPGVTLMADWMIGVSSHHIGAFLAAQARLERVMNQDLPQVRQALLARTGYHWRHSNLGVLSHIYWVRGDMDRALRLSTDSVAEARLSSHTALLTDALAWHALLLYLRGDDPTAVDALTREIRILSDRQAEAYDGYGLALGGLNRMAQGELGAADDVSTGVRMLTRGGYGVFNPYFATESLRLRAAAGAPAPQCEFEALLKPEGNPEHWAAAEVRRNLGEVLLSQGRIDEGRRSIHDAQGQARRQGALAWELRATISLFRSEKDAPERQSIGRAIAALRAQFVGGTGAADLRLADEILAGIIP